MYITVCVLACASKTVALARNIQNRKKEINKCLEKLS